MKLPVFAIYDNKLRAFMTPFTAPATGVAVRSFSVVANDPNNQMFHHGMDFTLFELARFDDESGTFEAIAHVNHGFAANYRERQYGTQAPQSERHEAQVQRGPEGGNSEKHV